MSPSFDANDVLRMHGIDELRRQLDGAQPSPPAQQSKLPLRLLRLRASSQRPVSSRNGIALGMMDRGLTDDEIRAELGETTDLGRLRNQWNGEGRRARAHVKAASKPNSVTSAPMDGAALLTRVREYLRRFVVYPSEHALVAHTLWVAHVHAMDAWESTPRLAFLSPEPGSGKTRALEATELLVPNPVEAVNVTAAYLFRKVASPVGRPTILFDEVDTVFGQNANEHEEIRGLLNAGHRKGAVAGRCVVRGKAVETEEIPAYCAVALAGLGNLPDTILSRSVIVRMRRRAPGEHVEPFRRRVEVAKASELREQLTAWTAAFIGDVIDEWPTMPESIQDRDADVWEALLAIADAAGGDWPQRARIAAVALVAQSKQTNPSLGVRLLADLQTIFNVGVQVKPTEAILRELHGMEEAPWGDLRGRPLTDRDLAKLLRPYEVKPKLVRIEQVVVRGYRREDLVDAWLRYLPPVPPQGVTSVATVTAPENWEVRHRGTSADGRGREGPPGDPTNQVA